MAFTYRWNFDPLEVEYSSASLANVVSVVHWQYHAETVGTSSLGVSGSFEGINIGKLRLDPVASADFTAYESLTEAKVLGWVTSSLIDQQGDGYLETMQTKISGSIAEQLHPVEGSKLKPW